MLFDTSVLIAHLRGDRRATELLLSVPMAQRLASVLARVEIEGGMRSGERASVAGLLDGMRLVPVTDSIARRAGEHLRRYRRSQPLQASPPRVARKPPPGIARPQAALFPVRLVNPCALL